MSDSEPPKSLASSLLDKLPGAFLGVIVTAATWVVTEIGRPVLNAIAQAATPYFLLQAIALLVIALTICVTYLFHLRSQIRRPLSSKYDFDDYGGYYIDRKTHRGICARCLAGGLVIHLMDVDGTGNGPKMCNCCQTSYRERPQRQQPSEAGSINKQSSAH